jgi:hypothetical protein
MTTSLPPPASHPSAPPPSVTGPAPKPRRRRWWINVGILAACMVGVGIAGIGLNWALDSADTYTADLTEGLGDFKTIENANNATFYRADGYHLVAKSPGPVIGGVTGDASHMALAAKVTVRAVTAPPEAAFGPFVMAKLEGAGYWLSVDSAGTATLAGFDTQGNDWVVASAKAPPLGTGTTRTLMLTCSIDLDGTALLGGYVDGTRVISGAPLVKISGVTVTGMMGYAVNGSVPAEWVATQFTRVGSHDLPKDAPR